MGNFDLNRSQASDMTNAVKDVTVLAMNTDAATGQQETTYQNSRWSQQFGYFNKVPDLKSAIILKATWNVGKGYETDAGTKVILDHITGWGKDSFEDILFNLEVVKRIGGDAYAEIIRLNNVIVNLKPLDTGSIKIVVDAKGIIKRYEQTSKIDGKVQREFKPEDILHFSNNRLADQIHGISDIDAVEEVIKADNEVFVDLKSVMHRQARPMILWKLKTDDDTKIAQFVAKVDAARNLGEDMFIPDDEDMVTHEVVQIPVNNGIFSWTEEIRNKFYRTIGLPQIVPGAGGQSTQSESEVIYLAFEQIVEKDQKQIERQIKEQLGLVINLIPPTTLSKELQQSNIKDGDLSPQLGTQQNGT